MGCAVECHDERFAVNKSSIRAKIFPVVITYCHEMTQNENNVVSNMAIWLVDL